MSHRRASDLADILAAAGPTMVIENRPVAGAGRRRRALDSAHISPARSGRHQLSR
jgi:hypothetical protein